MRFQVQLPAPHTHKKKTFTSIIIFICHWAVLIKFTLLVTCSTTHSSTFSPITTLKNPQLSHWEPSIPCHRNPHPKSHYRGLSDSTAGRSFTMHASNPFTLYGSNPFQSPHMSPEPTRSKIWAPSNVTQTSPKSQVQVRITYNTAIQVASSFRISKYIHFLNQQICIECLSYV